VVKFEPSSGVVPPKGSVELQATFVPRLEQAVNYNVVGGRGWRVRRWTDWKRRGMI
jgi:hypothetical protein